ncbi:LysE family translocator [Arthrobacter sp. NPDC056691]|uniref:LysE family translocator n=1 Tax=Arthrobacter sp. NPDC056691 TaxID=3345913 RepID=UPI00366BD03E
MMEVWKVCEESRWFTVPGVESLISPDAAVGVAVLSLAAALVPGPNMMHLVSGSMRHGRAAGFISLAGTLVGFVPYLIMVNLGLAAIFSLVPALYAGLKVAGAAYLICLCVMAFRGDRQMWSPERARNTVSHWRLFRMGLLTNVLNPKTALIYLALVPQFVVPGGDAAGQGFVLGGIQICVSLAVNAVTVLVAASISASLASKPNWMMWRGRVSGVLLGAAGLMLGLDASHPPAQQ